jgi:pilus assembly protein Flp/PilA
MAPIVRQLLENESGATAIEYGLIAALIASAVAVAATTVGANLGDMFSLVADQI